MASLFPHVVEGKEISKVCDEWMMCESDDKVEEIGEHNRVDDWWHLFLNENPYWREKVPSFGKIDQECVVSTSCK